GRCPVQAHGGAEPARAYQAAQHDHPGDGAFVHLTAEFLPVSVGLQRGARRAPSPSDVRLILRLDAGGRAMYIVHMKRYGVAEFRKKLARVLDDVERGEPVVVERGGRRFRLVAEKPPRRAVPPRAFFKLTD